MTRIERRTEIGCTAYRNLPGGKLSFCDRIASHFPRVGPRCFDHRNDVRAPNGPRDGTNTDTAWHGHAPTKAAGTPRPSEILF